MLQRLFITGFAILAACAAGRAPSAAQESETPGRIVGRVLDNKGKEPVAGAGVRLGNGVTATTDARGVFALPSVPVGGHALTVEMLGYTGRQDTVRVLTGQTTEVTVLVSRQPIALPPVQVVVRARWLEDQGFYERRVDHPRGTFWARDDIEKRGAMRLTDLLREAPGLRVHLVRGQRTVRFNRDANVALRADGGTFGRSTGTLPGCEPVLYVDGALTDVGGGVTSSAVTDWNVVGPTAIEAIEVYDALNAPRQYKDACGVVLVWTRRN